MSRHFHLTQLFLAGNPLPSPRASDLCACQWIRANTGWDPRLQAPRTGLPAPRTGFPAPRCHRGNL